MKTPNMPQGAPPGGEDEEAITSTEEVEDGGYSDDDTSLNLSQPIRSPAAAVSPRQKSPRQPSLVPAQSPNLAPLQPKPVSVGGPIFPDMEGAGPQFCYPPPGVAQSGASPPDPSKMCPEGVLEITPTCPEEEYEQYFDEDRPRKKIKFIGSHRGSHDVVEVQQIPPINPKDPPFYTSVMKVKPQASRRPPHGQEWTLEQAMGIKFHLCKICKQMFQVTLTAFYEYLNIIK